MKPTEEQIKETHDCSNCRFSKEIAPYKVVLDCMLDMETKWQPYTCDRWESYFMSSKMLEKLEVMPSEKMAEAIGRSPKWLNWQHEAIAKAQLQHDKDRLLEVQ